MHTLYWLRQGGKNMRNKHLGFLAAALVLLFLFYLNNAIPPAVYLDDFESGEIQGFWDKEFANTPYSLKVVDAQADAGSRHALRVELRKGDANVSGSKRAEIALPHEKPLEEYYYSFSTYLPQDRSENFAVDPNSSEIIAQWHNMPDTGEPWTSPPLALSTKAGHYYISSYWDDDAVTSTQQMQAKSNYSRHDLGSYENDLGRWVHWTFHVKWGWLPSQDPILKVYKNGRKVLDRTGLPNTTNDQSGVYMKIGLYKWDWAEDRHISSIDTRVIYYDNVQVQAIDNMAERLMARLTIIFI